VFAEMLESRVLVYGGVDRLTNNNNGMTATSFFTQSETTILAYGNNVIVGFNDSGSNNDNSRPGTGSGGPIASNNTGTIAGPEGDGGGGSAGFTGWSRSTDGGVTFTDGGSLPEVGAGNAGDPVFARNNTTGRIYFATLGFTSSTIQVFRSDNNAVSWMPAVIGTPGGSSEDKQWMTVDNFAGAGNGNVYLISRRFGGAPGIYLHRSTDHGATFSAGLQLWTSGQGAFVAVGPGHEVYTFSLQGTTIQMRKSTNLGVSFAAAVTVASGQGGGTNGDLGLTGMRNGTGTFSGFRSNGFAHVVIHPTTGHLFAVYANNPADADKGDIQMVTSTNGGANWSLPTQVNDDDAGRDQWQPTVAMTPDGSRIGVFYYTRVDDAANNLFRYHGRLGTVSGAGVVTFTPSEHISDVASMPEFGRDSAVNSVYMGDYDYAVATNDAFHVVWADNRSALPGGAPRMDPNVYYDRIPLAIAPTVTNSVYTYQTVPHKIAYTFDQNVGASLDTSDLVLKNLTTNVTIPAGDLSVSYNAGTNTGTFSYLGTTDGIVGMLPNGTYEAKLLAAGVTNAGGTPLAADHISNFFFRQGDANHDNVIDGDDYSIIDNGFNTGLSGWINGDFNYDGVIDGDDYAIIDNAFNTQ
jgi:hypothetical protein